MTSDLWFASTKNHQQSPTITEFLFELSELILLSRFPIPTLTMRSSTPRWHQALGLAPKSAGFVNVHLNVEMWSKITSFSHDRSKKDPGISAISGEQISAKSAGSDILMQWFQFHHRPKTLQMIRKDACDAIEISHEHMVFPESFCASFTPQAHSCRHIWHLIKLCNVELLYCV